MRKVGHGVSHSTWNPTTLEWDYWKATGAETLNSGVIAPTPSLPRGAELGIAPEDAERRLPVGATKVGSGNVARGLIAQKDASALSGLADDRGRLLLLAAGAYLVYRFLLKG